MAPVPDPQVVRGYLLFARVVAWITVVAGLLIVAGWQAGATDLAALFIGPRPIRLATGAGFIAGGTALLCAVSESLVARRLRWPLALLVLMLGAQSLLEHLGILDTGLRHLPLVGRTASFDAAMPPIVSIFFVNLGLYAGTQGRLGDNWIAAMLALAMLGTAMAALAAQGVSAAAGAESILSPATPGAAALLFANAIGWIAARPASRLCAVAAAQGYGGFVARRLLLPARLLPLAGGWRIQWARDRLGVDDALLIALSGLVTGGSVAILVWWVARLSGHIQYQRSRTAVLAGSANTDVLSGLANRRAFDAELPARLHELRTANRGFSLLLLDADRFKAYNDDFGHPAGDDALRGMGRLLHQSLRPGEHAARIGGEEFAVLLSDADRHAARLAGERIRAAFAAHPWPRRAMTVSIGVAQVRPDDTATTLLGRADAALYEAKNSGRARVVVAL